MTAQPWGFPCAHQPEGAGPGKPCNDLGSLSEGSAPRTGEPGSRMRSAPRTDEQCVELGRQGQTRGQVWEAGWVPVTVAPSGTS